MILDDLKLLDIFNLEVAQKEKLLDYFRLVESENKKYNLTAIKEESDFLVRHFYDSLAITKEINFKQHQNIMDLGTGAGFPGIPLAIYYPETNFYLVETTTKKCNFLKMVKDQLNLKNVTILNSRCEELPASYRNFFDFVVTRAVSELRIITELGVPFLKVNGQLIAYKGINYEIEIENAKNTFTILNTSLSKVRPYELSLINQTRYFIMLTKNKETDKKYPRNYSLIVKKPL